MKDLNKLKEEALNNFYDTTRAYEQKEYDAFNYGWDACVKAIAIPSESMDERRKQFVMETVNVADELNLNNPVTFDEFIGYWTEHNPNGKKMRFEKETVFDIKRRLQTWIKRDKKFNPKDTVGGDKKEIRMEGNYLNSPHFRKGC